MPNTFLSSDRTSIVRDYGTCKVTTPIMRELGTATFKHSGRIHYHTLYELNDFDRREFPWATHRMSLRNNSYQRDPLFTSCPVAIKAGTKYQLMLAYGEDSMPNDQWKLEHFKLYEEPVNVESVAYLIAREVA